MIMELNILCINWLRGEAPSVYPPAATDQITVHKSKACLLSKDDIFLFEYGGSQGKTTISILDHYN